MADSTLLALMDSWVREDLPTQTNTKRRKLKVDDTAAARKRAFLQFKLPFDPREGIDVPLATLTLHLADAAAGTNHFHIRRALDAWSARDVDWDSKPGAGATTATVTVVGGAAGDALVFDVTAILAEVASGQTPWYGFRLDVDTAGARTVHSKNTLSPDLQPLLEVTWTAHPDAPTDLSPDGGRVVSAARPHLGWQFQGAKGETEQAKVQVRLATDSAMSAISWDSGLFPLLATELDLAKNLLPLKNQSDAETNTSGVGAKGSATITRDTGAGNPFLGAAAFKIVTGNVLAGEGLLVGTAAAERFPVTVGEVYTLQAMLKGAGTVKVSVLWYQADGTTLISEQDTDVTAYVIAAAYASPFEAHTPVAPALAAFASFAIKTTAKTAVTFYADCLMAEHGADDASQWQPAFPDLANAATRYWDVLGEDDLGRQGDRSEVASFTRRTQGALSISSPLDNATVKDVTLNVIHAFTGSQESVEHFIERKDNGVWTEILRVPRRKRTSTSWTVPSGYIRKTTDFYRVRIRVWDTYDRESRPGDPSFVEATSRFTFVRSATPNPVTTLVAAARTDPGVDLTAHRSSAPDYFALVVDGDRVDARIDPADVSIGGGDYKITYYGPLPNFSHAYEVEAVQNVAGELQHSQGNATTNFTSTPEGIWLIDPDDPTNSPIVMYEPDDVVEFTWGEIAGTFFPVGSQAPVRLLQQARGREGSAGGTLRLDAGTTTRSFLRRLRAIWKTGRVMRLIAGEVNCPVQVGAPSEKVLKVPTAMHTVSFPVWQVDEFDRL